MLDQGQAALAAADEGAMWRERLREVAAIVAATAFLPCEGACRDQPRGHKRTRGADIANCSLDPVER